MDTEDSVFLNPESLFENRRGGRSQSLSAVPREGEGSAFMPPGMNINANDDQRGFTEVNTGFSNKIPWLNLNNDRFFEMIFRNDLNGYC